MRDDEFITLHRGRPPILMRVVYLLVMVLSVALFVRFMEAKKPARMDYRPADDRTRPLFVNPCSRDMITIEVTDGTFRCLSKYPLDEQPGTAWPKK